MDPEPRAARGMRERMLAGELYLAEDPQLIADSRRCTALNQQVNRMDAADNDGVRALLRELCGSFGDDSWFRPPVWFDYGYQTHVGARVFANYGLMCMDVASITIGDDVQIGPNVQLLTPTHPLEPEARRAKWESARPIVLGDNVWLGGGVIVCPGVTIGADTVVGAGSVVTHDLPSGVLAVGNPARVVRSLVP
jgi:maltose O-acetyltransferase